MRDYGGGPSGEVNETPPSVQDEQKMRAFLRKLPPTVVLAAIFVCFALAVPACGGVEFTGDLGADGKIAMLLSQAESGPKTEPPRAAGRRPREGTFVATLDAAPYPYRGKYADTRADFFDFVDPQTGLRYHTNRYGDRFPEKDHYTDRSVLFHIPPHFDPKKPFAYLVFFHGIGTDVHKSNVDYNLDGQVDASGKNVILVIPQLPKDAADSSPGKFFRKGAFKTFMDEVAAEVTMKLGRKYRTRCVDAPIILAAFSGGYKAAAYTLDRGGTADRIRGVVLLDALYEDVDKFEKWIGKKIRKSFFVNVFTRGACERNSTELAAQLGRHGLRVTPNWPARPVSTGELYFVSSETGHMEIPLLGPPMEPLANLLRLVTIGKGK
jgi:hypothetical protein